MNILLQCSMNAVKVEPDSGKTLPVSPASNSQMFDVKQEEHSGFPSIDWEAEVSHSSARTLLYPHSTCLL